MTKRHGVLGDTAINAFAMISGLLGGLGTQSILAWQLGPLGRGEYGAWLAIATIISVLFSLGADRAIQYFLISDKISVSQAVTSAIFIGLSGTVLGIATIGYATSTEWALIERVLPKSIGVSLLVIPGVVLPTALHFLLTGLRHFTAAGVLHLLRAGSQLGLAALLLVKLDWGIEGAFVSNAISALVFVVGALVYLMRKYGRLIARVPMDICMQMFWYAMKFFPARLGCEINGRLVVLFLAFVSTKDEVGLFSVAVVLMGQFLVVSDALNQSIVPRIGKAVDGQSNLVAKCCRYSLLLYGILLVVGVSVLSFLLPTLFSPKFQSSIMLMWLLIPGVWLRGATKPLVAYFGSTNLPSAVSTATIIEIVTTILMLAVFYPMYGLPGAAAAVSCGYGFGALALSVAFSKYSDRQFLETWKIESSDRRELKEFLVNLSGSLSKQHTSLSKSAEEKRELSPEKITTEILASRVLSKSN